MMPGEATLQQYRAVREGVGLIDLSDREKIEATGPDRITFLHSMVSNDVQKLADFSGRYGTLLTARGKMVADFYYYRFPEFVLLDLEPGLSSRLLETLEKYIIMDEVFLQDVSLKFGHFSLQGPASLKILQQLTVQVPETRYEIRPTDWKGGTLWLIRKNHLADTGFELLFDRQHRETLHRELAQLEGAAELKQIGEEAATMLRIERGIPQYGADMDASHYPMEARLDEAISLDKGCYIGQEVVAKATHIGGVSRHLVRLKLEEDDGLPTSGATVLSPENKPVGHITSAAFSPQLQKPLAFAYLKKAFAASGQRCQVEFAAHRRVAAEVIARTPVGSIPSNS